MAILPCRLDDETGGNTHDAPGARHSGDSTVSGALIASTFSYLRDRTVHYTQASVDYADTIPARVAPLVWGGTPASSTPGTVNRTTDTYHIFSVPAQGGMGTHYICGQAQWQTIGDTYDVLGLEVLRQYEWTRYQWKPPIGCPFWTKSASDPIVRWIAGSGALGWTGDGGDPRAAALRTPYGITKGPDGAYYVGCDGAVRRVTCHNITTVAGTGTPGHTGDGPATSTPVRQITGVVFDSTGKMWVTDYDNTVGLGFRIFGYTALEGSLDGSSFTQLNTLDPLHPPFGSYWLPNAPFHLPQYNTLRSVDLNAGTLVTSPLTRQGPGFSPGDKAGGTWALSQGTGLAIGPDDTLYVSMWTDIAEAFPDTDAFTGALFTNFFDVEFNGLFTVDPTRTVLNTLLWTGYSQRPATIHTLFPLVFIGTVGYPIQLPGSPWVTPDGSVYWPNGTFAIARSLNGDPSVQKRSAAGAFSQIGTDYNFEGTALAVDGAGNVYAADTRRHVILRWDPLTGITKVICGVLNSPGNTPTGSPGPATKIRSPQGIHVTPEGIVTFTDTGSNRLLQLGGHS